MQAMHGDGSRLIRFLRIFPRYVMLATALFAVACTSSDDDDSGTAIFSDPEDTQNTTSGGLATINTGDSILAFIPIGASVAVIELESLTDAAVGSAVARRSSADESAMPTIDISFAVDSCGADNISLRVVCVGYSSSMIAIIDIDAYLRDGTTPVIIEVDSGVASAQGFSGGLCINCGVLTDANFNQFVVSSSDGYRVYDYEGALKASYLSDLESDIPRNFATENFSFDPVQRLIISPEYSTTNQYLWLINIDSGEVFRWANRMVSSSVDEEAGLDSLLNAGIGSMVADSAAVDAANGIVVIGDEYTNGLLTLNMGAATFDSTEGTFDAPDSAVVLQSVSGQLMTTGLAVEPFSHLLFLENEFGTSMGVVQLPVDASGNAVDITEYNTSVVPAPGDACPSTGSWVNVGDPHGLAIFTSNATGNNPQGLLINSTKTCAAVVDLAALLAAPKSADSEQNIVDSSFDLLANGVVRFVDISPTP